MAFPTQNYILDAFHTFFLQTQLIKSFFKKAEILEFKGNFQEKALKAQ